MDMDPVFMDKLVTLRKACAFKFPVTSGYRCPEYNDRISSTGRDGPHTTGRAVDINISGTRAYQLISLAGSYGMKGLGVKQHGEHRRRFLHLDDLLEGTRPWIWSYR
jgi:uncharacterized protein YcbK (DUF882 family)